VGHSNEADSPAVTALERALDRLYAAPFDDFLALRKELVAELRTAGDAAASREVAGAAKPTRTAWALNQVVRRQPEVLKALFRAHEAAASPSAGDGDHLRRTAREYRERVSKMVGAVREVLGEAGVELNAAQSRRVAETLQAASGGDGDARAQLTAARLVKDVDVEDPFAGLVVGEAHAARPVKETPVKTAGKDKGDERERARSAEREKEREREREKERDRREREKREAVLEEARARVSALEDAARAARAEARAAETTATKATRAAERARQLSEEAESRLQAAHAELRRGASS